MLSTKSSQIFVVNNFIQYSIFIQYFGFVCIALHWHNCQDILDICASSIFSGGNPNCSLVSPRKGCETDMSYQQQSSISMLIMVELSKKP